MKNKEEKKRKQDNYLPISINLVLKITAIVVGYMMGGISLVTAILGVYSVFLVFRVVLAMALKFVFIIVLIALILSFL